MYAALARSDPFLGPHPVYFTFEGDAIERGTRFTLSGTNQERSAGWSVKRFRRLFPAQPEFASDQAIAFGLNALTAYGVTPTCASGGQFQLELAEQRRVD